MPFVQINWFEGRSDEQKATVAKRITEALVEAGAKAEDCWVNFSDGAPADWYFGGERKR